MFTPGSRACGYKTASGLGKWPNRDPLEEIGGKNLYAFVYNNPLKFIDTDGRIAIADDVVVGGVIVAGSIAAWLATPQGQQWLRDTGRTIDQALDYIADLVKSTVRRCLPCSRRHPTWPRCSGPTEPASAVLTGAQGLYPGWTPYSAEVRDVRPADAAACPSGGEWYTIKTEFFAVIQTGTIYHTMPISVVCCNCCGRWLEGKSCRIIHPGRGSGGAPPPPSQPPFPGPR
jgi:hypothetical protein